MARFPFFVNDERSRKRAMDVLATLELGKGWDVTIEPHRRGRSANQNNLYHRWVGIIALETGHSHDEVHEALKLEFLPPRTVTFNGKSREYRPSTTGLRTDEMATYMTQVEAWAASTLGLILPTPEDLAA